MTDDTPRLRPLEEIKADAHHLAPCDGCSSLRDRLLADIPALVAEVERLRAALKVATDALTTARGWAMDDASTNVIVAAMTHLVGVRAEAERLLKE